MKKCDPEFMIAKWAPILKICGLQDETHYLKTAELAQRMLNQRTDVNYNCLSPGIGVWKDEHKEEREASVSQLIAMNLRILGHLKDLSKVKILEAPFYYFEGERIGNNTKRYVFRFPFIDVHEMRIMVPEFRLENEYENKICQMIIDDVNAKLDEGFEAWTYEPLESVRVNQDASTGDYLVIFYSRFNYIKPGEESKYKFFEHATAK